MTLTARIRALQERLGVKVDGDFGPETLTAVEKAVGRLEAYQRAGLVEAERSPSAGMGVSASAVTGGPEGVSRASGPFPAADGQIKGPPSPAIAMVDETLLAVACPGVKGLAEWVEPIRKACAKFEIDTIRRVAAFIAQMAHESSCFTRTSENLNYRAARLVEVWPSRFPTVARAQPYANNPQALANKVYANRIGNGDEASGDGWRFRGGGPLQLTGRANWTGFAQAMGMPLDQALAYGRTPEGGVMAAAWFWETNDINRLADTPGIGDESRRINGGEIGLADRKRKFDALVAAMLKRGT